MEMKVNVKATNYEGVNLGYSYKERELEVIQPGLAYLPENRFKNAIKKVDDVIDTMAESVIEPMKVDGHWLAGFGAVVLPNFPIFMKQFPSIFHPVHPGAGIMMAAQVGETVQRIDIMSKMMPLVHVLQDIALPISLIVATWGCIEWIIGTPGWKQKVKGAIIGFVTIYALPYIFITLKKVLEGLV